MTIIRTLAAIAVLAGALAGCGGGGAEEGGTPPPQRDAPAALLASSLPSADDAGVSQDLCTPESEVLGTYRMHEGRCLKSTPALRISTQAAPQRRQPLAASSTGMSGTVLMDWAERTYPLFFAPASQPTREGRGYTYRYYPSTGNFLALQGSDVFVYGPISGYTVAWVGRLADFECPVLNRCSVPNAPTLLSATAETTGIRLSFQAPDNAGSSPITMYTASCASGLTSVRTATGTSSPLIVTGVNAGSTYSCAVAASNAYGVGSTSNPLQVKAGVVATTTSSTTTTGGTTTSGGTTTAGGTTNTSSTTGSTTTSSTTASSSGSSGTTATTSSAKAAQQTVITMTSDPGDYIGAGGNYKWTKADAVIKAQTITGGVSVTISDGSWWSINFAGPSASSRLVVGTYSNLERWPFHDIRVGGLSIEGAGRGCNRLNGSFTVNSIEYDTTGTPLDFDIDFEQHCEGGTAALRGRVIYGAKDSTAAPGPVSPPPSGLWAPAAGDVPTSGNYVYLIGDPGDYILGGNATTYTGSVITASGSVENGGPVVHVQIYTGNHWWYGDFMGMTGSTTLNASSYYPDLMRYPFNNYMKGGLDWSGDGRGCNRLTGWFVVDDIAYTNGVLTRVKLRFEQHCEGGAPALHGQVNWTK